MKRISLLLLLVRLVSLALAYSLSRRSVTQSEEFKSIQVPANMQLIIESLENGYVYPKTPKTEEAWEMLHEAYGQSCSCWKSG